MRPNAVEPEILRPEGKVLTNDTLSVLTSLLDDAFRVPGTRIRFGLDPLIGMVPGLGDVVSSLASFLIIVAAWQRGLPRVTLGRMVANVAVETLVGAVPVAGDVFDVAWKANRRNLDLLQRASQRTLRQQQWHDWLFLAGVALAVMVLASIPVLALWLVIHLVRSH